MPITPQFTLSQTDNHIIIDISVPHVRVHLDSMHMALSESNRRLHWSCPPYLLILNFAHSFHETATEQAEAETEAAVAAATYLPTIQNGVLRLSLAKAEPGVEWTDLDLIGKLIPNKIDARQSTSRWIQQVTESTTASEGDGDGDDALSAASHPDAYGFLRMFHGVFVDWTRDGLAKEMYESPWPEETEWSDNTHSNSLRQERRQERREVEDDKFDDDRYFQDMECQDDYFYMCAMSMRPHWVETPPPPTTSSDENSLPEQLLANLSLTDPATPSYFTQEESLQLASIPYPLLPSMEQNDARRIDGLLMGLVDILFAFVYDHLMTDGEPTVESAWTVSILSATLSWLEDWLDDDHGPLDELLESVLVSSTRRGLIYPYLRNLDVSVKVWQHVGRILQGGRRCVIRCLLQTREVLHQSELYYLNNKLFLDPYLAWFQQCPNGDDLDQRMEVLGGMIQTKIQCSCDSLRNRLHLGLAEIENRVYTEDLPDMTEQRYGLREESDRDDDDDEEVSSSSDSESDSSGEIDDDAAERSPSERLLDPTSNLLDDSLGTGMSSLVLSGVYSATTKEPRIKDEVVEAAKRPMIEVIHEETS